MRLHREHADATVILRASVPLNADQVARLYNARAAELVGFFVSRTYDPEVALDLLAETFAAAFEDRRQFRGAGHAAQRAWLYGIARHQLADYFRAGQVERRAMNRLGVERRALTDSEYDRIEELAGSEELRRACTLGLHALAEDQCEAVRLRIIEERSYPEVAAALGTSEQTARARVSRGLRALRDAVAQEAEHA